MKFSFFLLLGLAISTVCYAIDHGKTIDSLMTALYEQDQFNGSILVAANGRVVYRNAFGEADFESHQKFTPSTGSCIASLSKQFTAMAIMILAEQKKLRYDDPISRFFPEIKSFADSITIRHLLTHTSGIPDVGDLGIDKPGLTEKEVMKSLKKLHSNFRKPGIKYQYSNTGYILLDGIIQKVSGRKSSDFINRNILVPLKMNNTFYFEAKAGIREDVATSYSPYGEMSGRPFGMYSTVDDLQKWDSALYTEKLVAKATLEQAFIPYPVKEGTSTYGFAWNIVTKDNDKFVWHTGNTGGFRAFIGRVPSKKISIILLTNKGNSKRMEISEAIINIIQERPFAFPPRSIAVKMYSTIRKHGMEVALKVYDSLRGINRSSYDFAESELNSLGYQLLSEKKKEEAIQIFKLNTRVYPASSNAFDSLAEGYSQNGNKELAIKYYEKAIELDPSNLNSINMLKKLKK